MHQNLEMQAKHCIWKNVLFVFLRDFMKKKHISIENIVYFSHLHCLA
ncbi:hypothetical protein E2C01_030132 [Portunus trituberculatus]|uniref:Uncharacterized protein n=1 Tax=Portunus trituberculatus TaxID=210409 RepID=A0A5B7ETE3_PORTR|nr:hypothetical protein [Portunus trituberculatus]